MGATPRTIWEVPAYLPYVQPKLTLEVIRDAETRLGFKLPQAYLDLLKAQNGGYIRYRLPDHSHRMIHGIGPHFPSIIGHEWGDVVDAVSFELAGLVPFDGDGHWYICIDYRDDRDAPSITSVDIECDSQDTIAGSFVDYLRLLELEIDDRAFVIPNVDDIDAVTARISEILGVHFEPPDSWAHGYPERRANYGKSRDAEWIWISPNRVSRGFVREDDPRYAELREMMLGEADRYLGLPPSSYIAVATDGARSKLRAAFRKAGIELAPLGEFDVEWHQWAQRSEGTENGSGIIPPDSLQ